MSFPLNSSSSPYANEVVFDDGDAYFTALLEAIAQAQTSIHFESYLFDQDAIGNRILEALEAAVKRGVRVLLSLDGIGSSQWRHQDAEKWRARGLEFFFFHPLPWQKSIRRVWRSIRMQRFILGCLRLNQRNHRKVCIIDGDLAFVGSMNVSARHLRSLSGAATWRDTAVMVKSEEAANFLRRCNEEGGPFFYKNLLNHIHKARTHIWITTPYFVPSIRLLRALRLASKRGVQVRLLFPHFSDFFGVKFAMQGFYRKLLRANIQIFEYLPSMLHAKISIIDDWVLIGSSNLDHRSLFQDREANLLIHDPKNIQAVKERFAQDLLKSKEVIFADWRRRPFFNRLLEKFCLLFRAVL